MAAFTRSDVLALSCVMNVFMVNGSLADPPASSLVRHADEAMGNARAVALNDDVYVYRGELSYRGQAIDGVVDMEFRLYATDVDPVAIGPVIAADQWPVTQGVVLVGLDFGADAIPIDGAWLEVTVDGVILSPRQYVSAPGWSLSGDVTRDVRRNASVVESRDPIAGESTDQTDVDATSSDVTDNPSTGESTLDRFDRGRRGVNGDATRSPLRSRDGGQFRGSLSGDRDDSLTNRRNDDPVELMQFATNRWFNASGSLFMNIDSDNDDADTQSFQIVKNTATDVGGTTLFRVLENGRVGIGTTTPQAKLDVSGGSIRTSGQFMSTVATGTPPLTVSSTTNVTNLNADLLDGLNSTAFLQSIPVPLTLSGNNPTQIIKGENASTVFPASGVVGSSIAASGFTFGVYGVNASPDGRGVQGMATATSGFNYGVGGQSDSTSGRGVFGWVGAPTGQTYAVSGSSASTSGTGVYGYAFATSGTTFGVSGESASSGGRGVYGLASAVDGVTYGGWFQSNSTSGRGVYGWASAATTQTYGVGGESDSTSGFGVTGLASAATGSTYGGFFQSSSTAGTGVMGLTIPTTGLTYGGNFESRSSAGVGALGYAPAASGVTSGLFGRSNSSSGIGTYGLAFASTGTNYGVYGQTQSATGWGVYSIGNMGATGTKSFRIDHPSDPTGTYLLHYCTESPFPQNFYSGNVVTDEQGYAWVELPEYFEAINTNFKYQLTVIDDADSDAFTQAKVSREIRGNRFQLRTSVPHTTVSWRIEANRNDLWVRTHGAPDIIEKQGVERGTYQHAELYGQPVGMGMMHVSDPPDPRVAADWHQILER